jgi:hypothetical protein
MNDDEKGLMIALLHELSDLKARVVALQDFCVDLLVEKSEDREEAFRKIQRIYDQIEPGARKSTAIRVRKHCAGIDEDFLKKSGLI